MAIIDIITEDSLLILTVTGKLTANEMIAIILEHYSNHIGAWINNINLDLAEISHLPK